MLVVKTKKSAYYTREKAETGQDLTFSANMFVDKIKEKVFRRKRKRTLCAVRRRVIRG